MPLGKCAGVNPVILALLFAAAPLRAGDAVSTRCQESEVLLGGGYSSSRLGECGPGMTENLLWHLDRIDQISPRLDGTFHRDNGGAGAVVYILDTGVLRAHTEFARGSETNIIAGIDVAQTLVAGNSVCRSADKSLAPCFASYAEAMNVAHGTSVASLVAGRHVGVAPDAAIVSVRIMNEQNQTTTRTYLDGLEAVIRHAWDPATPPFHTAIVNISGWTQERLNTLTDDPLPLVSFAAVEEKIRGMIAGVGPDGQPDPDGKKFLFVVAGNNVGPGCGLAHEVDRFPATLGPALDGLITVGGMTEENGFWAGACHGGVEVLAPATGIFSASITARDHYRGPRASAHRSGTSFAAPIVAGIAARMLSADPNLTPAELEARIRATPSRIANPDPSNAGGRVACLERPGGGGGPTVVAAERGQ
jgi:subtilisin family serine protease